MQVNIKILSIFAAYYRPAELGDFFYQLRRQGEVRER